MNKRATIRPYRLGKDTRAACDLEAAAFTEDYRRMGEDPRLESERECRVERLLARFRWLAPRLRFARMGYVAEEDGQLASAVLFSREGLKGSRWSIDAVGTHPRFQRRGLAKQLIGHTFEAIHNLGCEACTLKVREDNAAAYSLYRSVGFSHFHTSCQMKRDASNPIATAAASIHGLRAIGMKEWYSRWRERRDLAARATPADVLTFRPIVDSAFRRGRLVRMMGPLVMKLSAVKLDQWVVARDGQLVATVRTRADLTGNRTHEMKITIAPEWREELAADLVGLGMSQLSSHKPVNTLIEIGGEETTLRRTLESAGFADMSVWHWLGVRFPVHPNERRRRSLTT